MGRFAPSPSGELHLGSLYAAVGAYLEARARGGRFLLRIEDLDRAREVPGAADRILRTLEHFGLEWDGPILRQSRRTDRYEAALEVLRGQELLYPCDCSRRELSGLDRYPGTCRTRATPPPGPHALRLRTDDRHILFLDRVQGEVALDLVATGDFVLRRRDGVIAYALAVVVDDADQGVTEVVRGADLLESTPAQIYLQSRLGLPTPSHAHLPVLTERGGAKLAKSRRSVALDPGRVAAELTRVLRLLGLDPPEALAQASPPEIWGFARAKWSLEHVPRTRSLAL